MKYFVKIIAFLFVIYSYDGMFSQTETDTSVLTEKELKKARKDSIKLNKNFRFSILGGPGYTPDFGFLIGGSALFTFSTNKEDTTLKRSVLPLAFAYMTSGGGSLQVKPQLFFNKDKFRIFGQAFLINTLDNYYGVGFEENESAERDEDSTQYRNVGYKVNPIFLFKLWESDFYAGVLLDANQQGLQNPSIGVQQDPDYIDQGGDSSGLMFTDIGVGLNISYDTRDMPANAYSGLLFDFKASFYSQLFGSTQNFSIYTIEYRQFKELKFLGKRKVLAWMANGRFTAGDVPIIDLSTLGSPFDLRGYYKGQFRDKNSLFSVVEYRSMFNAGDETKIRKLVSKLGFATWVGLGTVFGDLSDNISPNWMPNLGLGLRIEVQPRMNFRIDMGHDFINNQTLLYFNMTEAF